MVTEPSAVAVLAWPEQARGNAVFVDRDGVLVRDRPDYVKDWSEVEILPGSLEALGRLRTAGARVFVATNQSVVGRGIVPPEVLDDLHARLADLAAHHDALIEGFLVCPHRPEDGCACRKPKPGLLLQARVERGVDLSRAYMIGDQVSDVLAGVAAGCTAILVGDQRPTVTTPWRIAANLGDAVDLILEAHRSDR